MLIKANQTTWINPAHVSSVQQSLEQIEVRVGSLTVGVDYEGAPDEVFTLRERIEQMDAWVAKHLTIESESDAARWQFALL
jgi:hypothetical protein